MFKRSLSGAVLAGFLSFMTILPVLAHDGEEEIAITLSGRITLTIAVVAAMVLVAVLVRLPGIQLSRRQYSIIGLVVTTAVIHLLIGLNDVILLLNGLGYLSLLSAIYLVPASAIKNIRLLLYGGLTGYIIITILLFFVSHPWGFDGNSIDRLGLVTKAIEVILVSLVILDWRQFSQAPRLIPKTFTQLF